MVKKILGIGMVLLITGYFLNGAVDSDLLPLGKSVHKFEIGKIAKDQIINNNSNKTVAIREIIQQNLNTDVFVIGEHHDSHECHQFQKNFIEQLYQAHKNIIVGFEFFDREDDPVLAQWSAGKISEKDLLIKTGWYKKTALNYGYTRIIMDLIKKYGIKAIGLNVPRAIIRQVSRRGFSTLTKDQKALFPTIKYFNPDHEFFIKSIFGQLAVSIPQWFKGMYDAQKCWDVIMAESMKNLLEQKTYQKFKGVIIAGSNHVAYGLGIPYRYQKAKRRIKIATIVPIKLPSAEEENNETEPHPMARMMKLNEETSSLYCRGIADYVFAVSGDEKGFFPFFGITGSFKENCINVTRVSKNGIAQEYGLKKGDRIIKIDGIQITSLEQFRLLLAVKNWEETVDIQLSKKIKITSKKK